MKNAFFILIIFTSFFAQGQDFPWWARVVKWDGITPWQRYIITNPGFMGPNALPVPSLTNGSIDSIHSVGLTGSLHYNRGDQTLNTGIYGNYCVMKGLLAFDISWVPYEWFQMSHTMKEQRHVFSHYYHDKSAQGGIHLNTNVQVLKKYREKIHLAVRIGYRLPTSNGLGAARFTDAPGYYFDLSAAKPLDRSSKIKIIAMTGLYVWQTNLVGRRQNDAFLFAGGLEYNPRSWRMQLYSSGYIGYMNNLGDKPVVVRLSLEQRGKRLNGLFKLQQGINDFEYTSLEVGAKYCFRSR